MNENFQRTDYIMLCAKAQIRTIRKASSSPAFAGAKEGDIIDFFVPIARVGRNRRGTHASYISCENIRTGAMSKLSFNQLSKIILGCEFEQLIDMYE